MIEFCGLVGPGFTNCNDLVNDPLISFIPTCHGFLNKMASTLMFMYRLPNFRLVAHL